MPEKGSHPGVFLSKMLNDNDINQRDFASMINVPYPILNNILKGVRNINVNFAVSLEAAGYRDANYWLRLQIEHSLKDASNNEELNKKKDSIKAWAKVKELVPLSYLQKQNVGINSSDDIGVVYEIFGVENYNGLEERIRDFNPTYFRKSSKFSESKSNIVTWSLLAKFKALKENVSSFDRSKEEEILFELKDCFYNGGSNIVASVKAILNRYGIKFFVLDRPSQTPVDGKSFMSGNNPAIVLSLKYKRLDNFAFTLFHELGHVFEHLTNPKRPELSGEEFFINNNKNTEIVEFEADKYASSNLIDPEKFNDFILFNEEYSDDVILNFSKENRIHPAIVWGRICYEFPKYYRKRSSIRSMNTLS